MPEEYCAKEKASQFMLQNWLKTWRQYFLWKTIAEVKI